MPEGRIFLVPILLDDDVEIPDKLRHLHALCASDPSFDEQLAASLLHELGRLGVELERAQREAGVAWTRRRLQEAWDGFPGYDVQLDLLEFESDTYPDVSEIGDFLKGALLPNLFRHRASKLEQSPEFYNKEQELYHRTNVYDAQCPDPIVKGRILTLPYSISWYGAGAAHFNHHFETYSFFLEPSLLIPSLESVFFANSVEALSVLQKEAREHLVGLGVDQRSDDPEAEPDPSWIEEGTRDWKDFSAFVFHVDGIEVLFAPYQVGPFAYGSHSVRVGYEKVAGFMRPEFRVALELEASLAWADWRGSRSTRTPPASPPVGRTTRRIAAPSFELGQEPAPT